MGSGTKNFYADTYARCGYSEDVERIRSLWKSGDRAEATRCVPEGLVLQTSLIGDDARVRSRISAYQAAGVTSLRVSPRSSTLNGQIETLERLMSLLSA